MAKSTFQRATSKKASKPSRKKITSTNSLESKKATGKNDVLVSAVISTYLLTHLHQVLQRAEFGAEKEGRKSQAANFAQLRKLLCMDARSMADASAKGFREKDLDEFSRPDIEPKAA